MRNRGIRPRPSRLISVLLAALVVAGTLPPVPARAASANGDLTLNADQAGPVTALGFSTDQPQRYTPSGQLVDRGKSPFGVNKITKFGVKQVFMTGIPAGYAGWLFKSSGDIKVGAVTTGYKSAILNGVTTVTMTDTDFVSAKERVSIAADTDGDGMDETVTVFWVPGATGANGRVGITITKYATTREGSKIVKVEPTTTVHFTTTTSSSLFAYSATNNDYERSLHAVSGDFDHDGKDEVAVGRGKAIALYRVTTTKLTELSRQELKAGSVSWDAETKTRLFGDNMPLYVNGMASADLDDDGFQELFITAGRAYISQVDEDSDVEDYEKGLRSFLLIYRSTTNVKKPSAPPVELVTTAGENPVYFDRPAMDMGDIFGSGEKTLVIGGRLFGRKDDNNVGLTTFHYDPESDSYQTGLKDNRLYTFVSEDFKAVKNTLGVKCVNFDPAAFLSYVVLGGFIYKYNAESDVFDRQVITNVSLPGLDVNKESKSRNNLTNANTKKDQTYILDMAAGNFNEATLDDLGADVSEQLVVLHHNNWHDGRRIYVTTVSMKDGVLYAYMQQQVNSKDNNYYLSLCAPDIWDRGLQMEYLPANSEFVFSDPTVLAVLAATPYYSELEDEYEALGNASTQFGTGKGRSSSESHGLSVGASFICGYEFSLNLLYGNIASASWEMEMGADFTATFEKYTSVSKQVSYENYYNQNAVVVSATPYDCYYFKVTNTQSQKSENTTIMVPFSPVTRIMSVSAYEKVAGTLSTVPSVSGVFKHTIGDPRTYPSAKTSLSNVTGAEVLLGSSGDDYGNFVGVGIGNNVTGEEISIAQGKSRTLDLELTVKFTAKAGAGGAYVGGSRSLGYTYSNTKASEETAMYAGSVAGLPEERGDYSYKWSLAAYPYDLTVGDSKQRCMVVGYLCQPVGANYPPAPVKNLQLDTRTATSVKLKWEKPVTTDVQTKGQATGYTLYRADSAEGEYKQIASITSKNTVTYTDSTATGASPYYYRLVAVNTRQSVPVTLEVPRVKATAMTLKKAPTLSYTEGASLDLSNLAVTLTYEGGTTREVAFSGFGGEFLTSIADKSTLDAAQQGSSLTVTYVPGGITLDVGTLNVSAVAAYDIGLTASFTVGVTANATKLEAGKTVSATASLKNNTATAQPVLAILALYSDKGTMVASSTQTVTVAASGTSTVAFTGAFTVPASASGYTAKLFVWDGTSIAATKQIPKSNVITLS